jgi:hypothetical protein
MKSIVWMILSALGVAGVGVVAQLGSQDVDKGAGNRNTFTVDLAVDCRTVASGPNRGDIFIINGKLFPAGTLAAGTASNDPILPVNGVAPIGDWLVRGHHALPLPVPDNIAQWYRSAPGDFGTAYFIMDGGRTALIAESYAFLVAGDPSLAFSVVTGGIGRFRGAAGDAEGPPIGTNATGCPNFRTTFKLVPGSWHGAS